MDNLVEFIVEVDSELFEEATKLCTELGTTLEKVTVAFLKFCAIPENLPRVKEILGICRNGEIQCKNSKT